MKTDISKQTDVEIQSIIDKMIDKGWTQEDEAYINNVIDINDKEVKVHIVFFPKLLSYYHENEWVTIPWICGRFFYDEVGNYIINEHELLTEMKNVIKYFTGLTPFKDEDALAGWLAVDDGEPAFFINPDFPKGIWSNHTLG